MGSCSGCIRSWEYIRRKDSNKYRYKVLDQDMARFFSGMSNLSVSVGDTVCKKCQVRYHAHKRDERRSADVREEPQPGPSSAMGAAQIEQIEEMEVGEVSDDATMVPTGMFTHPLSPEGDLVFTPTSFTHSPQRESAFIFPPVFPTPLTGAISSEDEGDDDGEDTGDDGSSGDAGGNGSDSVESDADSDYEPPRGEYTPIFRLSISSRQYCIYGCQNTELSTVKPSYRAEMIIFAQVYIPVGAKICSQHENQRAEPIVSEELLSIQQYVSPSYTSSKEYWYYSNSQLRISRIRSYKTAYHTFTLFF